MAAFVTLTPHLQWVEVLQYLWLLVVVDKL